MSTTTATRPVSPIPEPFRTIGRRGVAAARTALAAAKPRDIDGIRRHQAAMRGIDHARTHRS